MTFSLPSPSCLLKLPDGGNQKTPLEYSLKSRHSGGQEKVFCVKNVRRLVSYNWKHSGLFNLRNSAMVLSKLSLLSRGFFRRNSNSRFDFQMLSINQNFSASVRGYHSKHGTAIIFVSTNTDSFESSDAMARHSDRLVHDQCTESQQPMKGDFDWCTIMLSQWKRVSTSAQGTIENLH